jgi:hypothetical protein
VPSKSGENQTFGTQGNLVGYFDVSKKFSIFSVVKHFIALIKTVVGLSLEEITSSQLM